MGFPGDFSHLDHTAVAQKLSYEGFPKLFRSCGLASEQLCRPCGQSQLIVLRKRSRVIWEAQNQYYVQLDLSMEHHYHTSVDVGPGYSITLPHMWKSSETFNCFKELIFHDSQRLHHLAPSDYSFSTHFPYIFVGLCIPLAALEIFVLEGSLMPKDFFLTFLILRLIVKACW